MDTLRNKPLTDSFCILPWLQVFIGLKGALKICCHSVMGKEFVNQKDEILFFHKHNLEYLWNCKSLLDIRMKMLKGERIADCELCYSLEEKAGFSQRVFYCSVFYEEYLRLQEAGEFETTLKNGGKTQFKPIYFNCNMGNRCNLACRMCSPQSSIVKAHETFRFLRGKNLSEFSDGYVPPLYINDGFLPPLYSINKNMNRNSEVPWQMLYEEFQESYDYCNDIRFWQQIEQIIPYLQLLVLHGGEPLLYQNEIMSLVDNIVRHRREACIKFVFVTNLIFDNPGFIKKLSLIEWKFFQIVFSIDGCKKLQEYIRYPLKWDVFENNINTILSLGDRINLTASITVDAYNVYQLTDVLDYLETFWDKTNLSISMNFLQVPYYLKTDILPQKIKTEAIQRIKDFMKRSKFINDDKRSGQLKNELDYVIKNLDHEDDTLLERRKKFVQFTRALDKLRGQNILDVCPEMEHLFS
ncbi:twitch domain-containing radical SAM protein [candidate division CSSED10-310 bacterium]|uniref:Twitch domain-containing radical SAM protein n=1 Tax=candidate division CSSED10-310 bacterium TaxID=2855610 RepID=A0ABV6YQS6_UNCC1